MALCPRLAALAGGPRVVFESLVVFHDTAGIEVTETNLRIVAVKTCSNRFKTGKTCNITSHARFWLTRVFMQIRVSRGYLSN